MFLTEFIEHSEKYISQVERVYWNESFSHSGKETFPLIPLCGLERPQGVGERKKAFNALPLTEYAEHTEKYKIYSPERVRGFAGMNLSPIPAKKQHSP